MIKIGTNRDEPVYINPHHVVAVLPLPPEDAEREKGKQTELIMQEQSFTSQLPVLDLVHLINRGLRENNDA